MYEFEVDIKVVRRNRNLLKAPCFAYYRKVKRQNASNNFPVLSKKNIDMNV